jgi:hypothetical protein
MGITVGTADTTPESSAHVAGVRRGNAPHRFERHRGHTPDGRSTARRSTGINARHREPISPDMPNLSPA